jgi:hypothetical protein
MASITLNRQEMNGENVRITGDGVYVTNNYGNVIKGIKFIPDRKVRIELNDNCYEIAATNTIFVDGNVGIAMVENNCYCLGTIGVGNADKGVIRSTGLKFETVDKGKKTERDRYISQLLIAKKQHGEEPKLTDDDKEYIKLRYPYTSAQIVHIIGDINRLDIVGTQGVSRESVIHGSVGIAHIRDRLCVKGNIKSYTVGGAMYIKS